MKQLFYVLISFGALAGATFAQAQQTDWILKPQKPYSLIPDLSFLNEKPAGTRGRVSALGNNLVFEDGSDARLWGANLQANALYRTEPAHVRLQAKRLAALGFNLVRIHHHDSDWVRPNVFQNPAHSTRQLNLTSMRKLDLWVEALKAEGIYIWLDIHVGRRLVIGDEVEAFEEVAKDGEGRVDGLNYFSPAIKDRMKEFQRAYLGYENHLSKQRYADDPAVVAVLITNENDLTHHYGNRLLPDKNRPHHTGLYLSAARSFAQEHGLNQGKTWRSWEYGPSKIFLNAFEHHFFTEMSGDLRQLGYRGLIVPTNFWGHMPVSSLPSLSTGAMIDVHTYGKTSGLEIDPALNADVLSWVASGHVAGMPLSISEWNVSQYPVADRFVLPLRMATLATFHGWDAPVIYGYAQQALNGALIPSNWDVAGDPAILSVLPASALIYRQRHLRSPKKTYALRLPAEGFFDREVSPKTSAAIRTLYEQSAFVVEIPAVPELPWLKARKAPQGAIIVDDPARSFLAPDAHQVISDTGEFARNFRDQTFSVTTEQTKLIAGNLSNQTFELGSVVVRSNLSLAAITVQSMDGQAIEKSKDILISLSTRTSVESRRPPVFAVEPSSGDLRIKAVSGLTLKDLKGNSVPAFFEDGWYKIDLALARGNNWLKLTE